jgi:arabinose-5-phosphate isomerase|tara:strand:+ start:462 stop:1421 length:960 start_codon:yes stop_codon:yes gene_type:complete
LNNSKSVEISSQVIDIQIDAINKLKKSINKDFDEIIAHLSKIKGRIIVTGIGKSAIIGMKISSTLNSTGSPSIFMHGSDALHGDLGTITKDDTLIYLSKSGNNSDTIELINNLNKRKIDVIAITANKDSYLGKNSKFTIYTPIEKEACPNNLAPTTSSGIQLLVGDMIAICLMTLNEFDEKSFAKFHPAGTLGKKLTTTTGDLINFENKPEVKINSKFSDAINEISSKMLGATAVLKNEKIVGIITDGDVRRILEKYDDPLNVPLSKIIKKAPMTVKHSLLAIDALQIMNDNKITNLVVTKKEKYLGMLHIHDIINAGL